MNCHSATPVSLQTRRGSAYFAVLGASMIVAIIGMGALSIVRSQRLTVTMQVDTVKARLYAQSAVEWGAQIIALDSNWRANHTSGVWYSGQPLGDGTITLEGIDADGDLANRPTDALTLKATATRGAATQIVQATLTASGPPLDALGMALHTVGQLHVSGTHTLTVTGAPASTNGTAQIDSGGIISGDLQCLAAINSGTVTGTTTILAPSKAMPSSGVASMYAALGTAISPGGTMTKVVLTPANNPYGSNNADGVYVISTSSNLLIKGVRIEGTLVIICPGKVVTIDTAVLFHNYRADYPALIVDGDVVLQYDSVNTSLKESDWNTSFNPSGAAYPYPNGSSNGNTNDTYPNEIQGLVHCRGAITLQSTARVRGAVICESSAGTNAVFCNGTNEIVYDPTLFTAPPMGYMKSVSMSIQSGSWRQVVLP